MGKVVTGKRTVNVLSAESLAKLFAVNGPVSHP